MAALMQQRCALAILYLNWVLYVGFAVAFAVRRDFAFLATWVVAAPVFLYAYVRWFPRLSRALGYGSVADEPAAGVGPAPKRVALYVGLGCPFCPIMETRLRALQPAMGFDLEVIDVTARPALMRRERVGAVPLIVVDDRRRAGCMTSRELVELIAGEPAPVVASAPGR